MDSNPPDDQQDVGYDEPGEVTRLLASVSGGDAGASDRLLEIVYSELRRMAGSALGARHAGQTLQPTAIVHEAWMKLCGQERVEWQSRAHFLGIAALAMRRVVVDHARAKKRDKRGGGADREPLHTGLFAGDAQLEQDLDILALNEALDDLQRYSERAARVVELRFFAGLTEDETAEVLGVTRPTVTRDWRAARAWLASRMSGDPEA